MNWPRAYGIRNAPVEPAPSSIMTRAVPQPVPTRIYSYSYLLVAYWTSEYFVYLSTSPSKMQKALPWHPYGRIFLGPHPSLALFRRSTRPVGRAPNGRGRSDGRSDRLQAQASAGCSARAYFGRAAHSASRRMPGRRGQTWASVGRGSGCQGLRPRRAQCRCTWRRVRASAGTVMHARASHDAVGQRDDACEFAYLAMRCGRRKSIGGHVASERWRKCSHRPSSSGIGKVEIHPSLIPPPASVRRADATPSIHPSTSRTAWS